MDGRHLSGQLRALVGCFGGEAKTPADSAKTPETPAENNPKSQKKRRADLCRGFNLSRRFFVPGDDFAYGGNGYYL